MKDQSRFKILIIEDDLELLALLREVLAGHFVNVSTACDGASAYIAFRDEKFDLVISDIRMSGFNGIELLRRARAEGHTTPFIMVSGAAEKEDVVQALKLGAKEFIEKPYSMEGMIAAVFRVIEIQRREFSLIRLVEEFGEEDDQVKRQSRMIGLFRAANAGRKINPS